MLKQISIDSLKVGMYVEQVTEQNGALKVSSKGWVKNDRLIDQLKLKGVLEVAIDPSKTIEQGGESRIPIEQEEHTPGRKDSIKPVAVEKELSTAKKIYNEAKQLQKRAFDDIKAGRPIDIEPVKKVSEQLIDSIFRNQDALLCITRIREKDAYLLEHSLNVSILMGMFAKHLEFDDEKTEQLSIGAFLHDIGKILIPDSILHKPAKLTEAEFAEMRLHVTHSMTILKQTKGISDLSYQVAAQHHEKLNGQGYPEGLKEEEISQAGRMITIVDIYDALTAERVYKKGLTPSGCFKLMMKMAGQGEIDGQLLQHFIKCIGIHPVGTLVKLSSGKLGIVTKSNRINPLKPVVKIFYHSKYEHHTDIKDIDLSKAHCNEEIEASVKPEQFKIELNKFFKEVLLNQ